MKPGDLVRVREPNKSYSRDDFSVGNIDMMSPGFSVPPGIICIVIKVDASGVDLEETFVHVMVPDGRVGWVYPEDCEVLGEERINHAER